MICNTGVYMNSHFLISLSAQTLNKMLLITQVVPQLHPMWRLSTYATLHLKNGADKNFFSCSNDVSILSNTSFHQTFIFEYVIQNDWKLCGVLANLVVQVSLGPMVWWLYIIIIRIGTIKLDHWTVKCNHIIPINSLMAPHGNSVECFDSGLYPLRKW